MQWAVIRMSSKQVAERTLTVTSVSGGKSVGRDDHSATIYQAPAPIAQSLHQLPAPPVDFAGRTREIEDFFKALQNGMTISGVYGMGGIGKTALALVVANKILGQYPDAQFFLDMRGVSEKPLTPSDAMVHVIRAYYPTTKLPDSEAERQRIIPFRVKW